MGFLLLGPVELWAGSDRVEIRSVRLPLLLAALAVDAGRVVTIDVLLERLWGHQPPRQVRRTLHSYVARLRRLVGQVTTADGSPAGVVRRTGGYLLDVEPDQVDVLRFRRLVEQARTGGGQTLGVLREAVGLWRGEPLTGMPGEWAERTRQSLRQERLEAVLAWAAAEVAAGTPQAVLGPLRELAAEHPFVEPVAAMQMRALAAAGRLADALDCYAATRARLAEELGIDPGAELQALHQAALRGELHPPPRAPAYLAVPAQLPPDVSGFAGRAGQLARLDALLTTVAADAPTAVVISAVSGTAGVGKTALAVHWAHRVADRFTDGQLYVNLRGFDQGGQVLEPVAAIRGFLDALGVPPGRIPADLHAQTALYRSLLSGQRILVVLDNARDAEQVRPLLPGTPTALALVTSRNQLTPLVAADGAHSLTLDLPSVSEAHELLARRLGEDRIAAEPGAAGAIVAACARLPLALGIAAARAVQTGFRLADLATELADAGGRLGALDAGDPATQVRTVFSWSYRALTAPAARLFRLLGLHPGPTLSAAAAVSLAAVPAADAGRQLAELARANLITEYAPARYRMHDLLAGYATELTQATDPEPVRRAATVRLLDHYVHSSCSIGAPLYPARDPIPLPLEPPAPGVVPERGADDQALAWMADAHPVLMALLRQAGTAGFDRHTWQLGWALDTFLVRRGHRHDAIEAWQAAAAAADRLDRPTLAAHARRSVGYLGLALGRHDQARPQLEGALDRYVQAGDRVGQAHTHVVISVLWNEQDQPARSLPHIRQAQTLFRAAGHRQGLASALNAAGFTSSLLGDHDSAITDCRQAIELFQQTGDRAGEAASWDTLGGAHHHLTRHAEALDCYRTALGIYRDLGDRYYEAATLVHAGDTHQAAGEPDAARPVWAGALDILTELDHPDADAVRGKLAAP